MQDYRKIIHNQPWLETITEMLENSGILFFIELNNWEKRLLPMQVP